MTAVALVRMDTMSLPVAAQRLYDAECALHAARQSQLDEWITSAAERLHEALAAYLEAVARG